MTHSEVRSHSEVILDTSSHISRTSGFFKIERQPHAGSPFIYSRYHLSKKLGNQSFEANVTNPTPAKGFPARKGAH